MLDSEVDFIILLGRGVKYDFDRTLAERGVLPVHDSLQVKGSQGKPHLFRLWRHPQWLHAGPHHQDQGEV